MLIGSTSQLQHQSQQHANDGGTTADQDLLNALESGIDAVVTQLTHSFVRVESGLERGHPVTSSAGSGTPPSATQAR